MLYYLIKLVNVLFGGAGGHAAGVTADRHSCVSDLTRDLYLSRTGRVCSEFISSVVFCLCGVLLKCAL